MEIFALICVFIFGSIIGSFLNVVIIREGTELGIGGRSGCMKCRKKLDWYELFPIFSYLFLRGKCFGCRTPISIQYPLVEAATGFLFVGVVLHNTHLLTEQLDVFIISTIFQMIVMAILVVIFVFDLYHKLILDKWSYPLAAIACIGLLVSIPFDQLFQMPYVLDVFAGLILALPFYLLWLVSGGRWIGLGDAKLALSIGWFLGLVHGVSAIILAFWIGGALSIIILLLQKWKVFQSHFGMASEIPFAPFLIVGLLIVFFTGVDVMNLGLFFE